MSRPDDQGALTTAGTLLSRHASIYLVGSGIALGVGLVNAIILTHFLAPSGYGRLGLLFIFAGFLTVFYNLFTLPGTFSVVFGGAGALVGDDGDGGDDVDDDDREAPKAGDVGSKRRALGTGLVMTVAIGLVGTLVVVALQAPIADLLQSGEDTAAVLWAAASGALGGVWRLVSHVLRLERRPVAYVLMSSLRPLLVIGIVIPLVANGHGVSGAVAGTAVGTALACAVALVVVRSSYRLTVAREFVLPIARRGAVRAPIIMSFYVIQNGDLLLLSMYAGGTEVGLYRLATRIASLGSYFTSSLFMAWGPLRRGTAFKAAGRERGQPVVKALFATYFSLLCWWLLLALAVGADTLVRVAPQSYADAAPLIPLVGAGFIAHGFLILALRLTSFPNKTRIYVVTVMVAAVGFAGVALILIPAFGAEGAAASVIVVFVASATVIGVLGQVRGKPVPYEYGRIVGALLVAAACFGAAHLLGAGTGTLGIPIAIVAVLGYPALLVVTSVIPRSHLRPLLRIARWAMPTRTRTPELREAVERLERTDAAALELLVGDRRPVPAIARSVGVTEPELTTRAVRALRAIGEVEPSADVDSQIGAYLFSDHSVADRELMAARLMKQDGVPAQEMYALERTLAEVRAARRRIWGESGSRSLDEADAYLT